jgi:Flp pilus assembly CpaE family ATPase
VVLVDADLRGGNVGPYLDLDPSRNLLGLGVGRHGSPASMAVDEELQEGPGFAVLAGIERPETHGALTPELVIAAVTHLKDFFEDVLVDAGEVTAATVSPVADALCRTADEVLLVSGAGLVAVWNAQCCLGYLREDLGLAADSLGIVVNRREGRGHYGAREVEQALGLSVLAVVPEDRRAARRAAAAQLPITAAGGKVAREFRSLAARLTEQVGAPKPERQRRRWPARLKTSMAGRR